MRATDIIASKRDGKSLTTDQIRFMVRGYTAGEIPDYQLSALLMAIYLRGMDASETAALTDAMLHSGDVIDFSDLGEARVDKHSTGGVGDKTSLVVAPVVAAAGVYVPMISGRALAHSGGTLDKLESIPGFRTNLSLLEFRQQMQRLGVALIGQTEEIAPADRKLYALRDVTATVACRPLMAASIMSKKMAEGISGLVLDVKTGSGAFLKTEDESRALARTMIQIAQSLERDAVALLTDMNQPLGRAVGNALEVVEALETLKGRGPSDFDNLCRELSAEMLVLSGTAGTVEQARTRYDELIDSGAGLEKMQKIIEAQSGDPRVTEDYSLLPASTGTSEVRASSAGFIEEIDTEMVGRAAMLLGAGRVRLDTQIDYGVGMVIRARIGDQVHQGSSLATLHFNDRAHAEESADLLAKAYKIGPREAPAPVLIKERIK